MSQSKKKAAGTYKAPLTLLYAGIAAQAFGIAALALVSRRVLDEGGSPWGWVLLFLALALPLLDGGLDLLSGRTVDRAAVSLRRDTLDTLLSKDAEAYSRYHSGQVFSRLTQDAYTVCEWRVVGRPQVAGQLIRLLCAASALFFVNHPPCPCGRRRGRAGDRRRAAAAKVSDAAASARASGGGRSDGLHAGDPGAYGASAQHDGGGGGCPPL